MTDRKHIKDQLTELEPKSSFTLKFACPMNWEDMEDTNDSRCKHCVKCDLHVYDLVGLNAAEIGELVDENGGEICGQAYIRADNRVSFDECRLPRKALRGKIKPSFPNG